MGSAEARNSPNTSLHDDIDTDHLPTSSTSNQPPPTRFRFKSHHRKRRHDDDPAILPSTSKRCRSSTSPSATPPYTTSPKQPHRRRHHHHRHHRSKRRSPAPPDPPPPDLDAETAFRESLFDALADDEGAAFWQGVYGQPIHTYPRPPASLHGPSTSIPAGADDLEQMSDDAYADYVRARMWERTHEAAIAERAARTEARRHRKEKEEEAEALRGQVEASLRRGEMRREGRVWEAAWRRYVQGWEALGPRVGSREETGGTGVAMSTGNGTGEVDSRDAAGLPWPVRSGLARDVSAEAIEAFFVRAGAAAGEEGGGGGAGGGGGGGRRMTELGLREILKRERVRWHPDKVQQRLAGQGRRLDAEAVRCVTAVFQVVDGLWAKARR